MDLFKKITHASSLLIGLMAIYVLSFIPKFNQTETFKYLIKIFIINLLNYLNLKIEILSPKNNLPKRFIVIANHVSILDAMILYVHFTDCCYVIDIEHTNIPIIGRIIKMMNILGVDRKSKLSRILSIEKTINHVSNGSNILIFPQGETSDQIIKFNLGAFITAKKTLVPIVPVFLEFKSIDMFCFSAPWNLVDAFRKITKAKDKTIKIRVHANVLPEKYENPQDLCDFLLNQYQQWYLIYQEPHRVYKHKPEAVTE